MRYPIDEKTKKPYGVPKGVKVEEEKKEEVPAAVRVERELNKAKKK